MDLSTVPERFPMETDSQNPSASAVESPKYMLEVRRAGDEGAPWGWAEVINPHSGLRATGSPGKVSCRYLTFLPCSLSICRSEDQRVMEIRRRGY